MTAETGSRQLWLPLAGVLAASVGAAIVSTLLIDLAALIAGYRFDGFSLQGLAYASVAFAAVFLPLGVALIVLFWKRRLFDAPRCFASGAVGGGLVSCLALLILSNPFGGGWFGGYYVDAALLICIGMVSGAAGGIAFWQICRLGYRERHD